jgi:hypothetical protein
MPIFERDVMQGWMGDVETGGSHLNWVWRLMVEGGQWVEVMYGWSCRSQIETKNIAKL